MFVRSAKWLVVVALAFTLGGHWTVLQVVAWARMAADFSQTESLPVAISKTFNGKNPCKLCKLVNEGKKAEQESDANVDSKKMDSLFVMTTEFYFAPLPKPVIPSLSAFHTRSDIPLSPPPESA